MRLFEAGTTDYSSHGLGDLNDAISCRVTRESLMYELQMEYPAGGKRFSDLRTRRIIVAKPDQVFSEQPFIIYRISKEARGRVSVYARQIGYELSGIVTNRFTATSAADFASKVKANAMVSCPFNFATDVDTLDTLDVSAPVSIRSLLGGSEDTWQGAYGGELVFDNMTVSLLRSAGQDRGVVIRYGVDLVDATMEENISEMRTGIVPYYKDETVFLTGPYTVPDGKSFSYVNAEAVDLTMYFQTAPADASALAPVAQAWMADNRTGVPEVSLRVTYAQLDQVVALYDVVTVQIVPLGIDVQAKISRTVYDVIRDRYESVDIGKVRTSLSDDMWDAGRLRKGLLPVERIRDRSIGSGKLGGGAVTSATLGKDVKDSIDDAKDAGTNAQYNLTQLVNTLKDSPTYQDFRNSAKDKPS